MLNFLSNLLADAAGHTEFFAKGMAYLAAGIAILTGFSQGIGQGFAAGKAVEAIAGMIKGEDSSDLLVTTNGDFFLLKNHILFHLI